jgi:hypothetical protein
MTETFPQYQPLRQPEYFILKHQGQISRIRVPWIAIRAVVEIIESSQGRRELEISWGYIPGPATTRLISRGSADYLLMMAKEEGWIE